MASNSTVPAYKDADAVTPPWAARAADITGSRSFPYSLSCRTVSVPRPIRDREGAKRVKPTITAPASGVTGGNFPV